MRLRFVCLLLIIFSSSCFLQAQERCGTVQYMQNLFQRHGIQQSTEQFEEWLQQRQSILNQRRGAQRQQAGTYEIPVVFHIIHNGESIGVGSNVSDARIFSQLQVLNEDFNRTNADAINTPVEFLSVAGSLDIEFVMAKQTPDGESTNGINRVQGSQSSWSPFDPNLNAQSYWPSSDYLNIWVTNIGSGFLGYAQFPVSTLPGLEEFQEDGIATTDGVVIDFTVFGVGSPDPDYNLGRTVTHEIGHFLGLRHIWGDTANCSGTDYMDDTPNQADETIGCPAHPQSECSGNKMFQNYMDYTDDACMNIFTDDQVERMTLILDDSEVPRRNSLLTSPGLQEPVIGTIDLALIEMTRPGPVTCEETPNVRLKVVNQSPGETITEVRVRITLNDGAEERITISGLNIDDEGEISFPSPPLALGENILNFKIIQINDASDPDPNDNELETTVTIIYPECEPFAIYWNNSGGVDLTFNLSEPQQVQLSVVNTMGSEITSLVLPEILNQTIAVPTGNVPRGLYIIRLRIGNKYYATKVYLSP